VLKDPKQDNRHRNNQQNVGVDGIGTYEGLERLAERTGKEMVSEVCQSGQDEDDYAALEHDPRRTLRHENLREMGCELAPPLYAAYLL
jgi:hypothetical protein